MKKSLLVLTIVLTLCLLLIGCGAPKNKGGTDTNKDTSKPSDTSTEESSNTESNVIGTKELDFYPLGDGTYAVGIGEAKLLSEIVIPELYQGMPVTEIATDGFQGAANLKEILIPEGIYKIGAYAFDNCPKLTKIVIASSVKSIEVDAFSNCARLEEIEFNAKELGDLENGIFSNSGGEGNGIKVTIGKKVTKIPTNLFMPSSIPSPTTISATSAALPGAPKITSVVFENGSICKSIGESAFASGSFKAIEIPNSVTKIGKHAFLLCTYLENIKIPAGLEELEEGTFHSCASLVSVKMPSGLKQIGESAFSGCYSLEEILIPNSVTKIGKNAFLDCSELEIYIEATSIPSEWDKDWNISECAVYFYSEEEPTAVGRYWHYSDGEIADWKSAIE